MAPRYSFLLLLALSCVALMSISLVAGTCVPKECPNYSDKQCYDPQDISDGCGGTKHCPGKSCPTGKVCKNHKCECPPKCTVHKNGKDYEGVCATSRPDNTLCGGEGNCPHDCGKCYIPDNKICGTSNGPCARANKCRCFMSYNGAACKKENIVPFPGFDGSKLGTGGGCDESQCNGFSQSNGGGPMACCPYDCK